METDLPDPATLARIGAGASAEVLLLPDGRALKLLLPGIGDGVAERELTATRLAHRAALPVPAPLGRAVLADRHGLLFERLSEARLARRMRRWPGAVMVTLFLLAREQARAHAIAVEPGTLATAHAALAARVEGSAAPADAVAADVARSELVMRFGRYGPWLRRWPALRVARDAAAAWYLFCYRALTGMDRAAVDAWRLPVAVAWLREGSAAHQPALAAWIERRLARRGAG